VAMASSATTKAARRAAREAVVAAQADLARRTRANMDDLAVFLSARQRADAVDDWFNERVAALAAQADERRAGQRRECGVALAAMRERGESIRDIARMAGIGEKTVRELIRAASTGDPVSVNAAPLVQPTGVIDETGREGEKVRIHHDPVYHGGFSRRREGRLARGTPNDRRVADRGPGNGESRERRRGRPSMDLGSQCPRNETLRSKTWVQKLAP